MTFASSHATQSAPTPGPAPGVVGLKILKVGILAGVHNLHPLEAQDADSAFVLRQILDTPFGARAGGTDLEPSLFASAMTRRSEGGRQVYRGRLRGGVRFWDGSEVRPDDVVACLDKVPMVNEQADTSVEGDEIVFRMHRPNAGFEHVLFHSMCGIYKMAAGRMVGTGPFRVADDSDPDHISLERNEHYRSPTPLDELHFVTYDTGDDGRPTPLLEALETGDVHFSNVLSKDDIETLSGVRKSFLPGIATSMLFLNTTSPKLADRRLRQALARSVDRVEVARTSYANALAFAATSILPRTMGLADDSLDYSPRIADRLLKEDGVEVPDSLKLSVIWAPRPYLPHPMRVVEAITEQLGQIGVRVEAEQPASASDFLDQTIAGRHDMVLSGWIADTMDPYDFLESNLASSRVPAKENIAVANNAGRLSCQEMDDALAAFRADHDAVHLERVMEVLSEEAPLVPLCYGPTAAVWSFKVKNFKPSPLSIFPFVGIDLEV